jgi:ABC-type transport system involved in multi-copper enzyme maturation permease subunit
MGFGMAMLLFFCLSMFAATLASAREGVMVITMIGGWVLSFYSAMGMYAPEQSNRTITFLASKPVAAWKVFLIKWFMGWCNFAVPMAIALMAILAWVFTRIGSNQYDWMSLIAGYLCGLFISTMFYTIIVCLEPRRGGEGATALFGILVFAAMFIHMGALSWMFLADALKDLAFVRQAIIYCNPLCALNFMNDARFRFSETLIFYLCEEAILFIILMAVGMRRWKRV